MLPETKTTREQFDKQVFEVVLHGDQSPPPQAQVSVEMLQTPPRHIRAELQVDKRPVPPGGQTAALTRDFREI